MLPMIVLNHEKRGDKANYDLTLRTLFPLIERQGVLLRLSIEIGSKKGIYRRPILHFHRFNQEEKLIEGTATDFKALTSSAYFGFSLNKISSISISGLSDQKTGFLLDYYRAFIKQRQ